jgi:hypothetical protein
VRSGREAAEDGHPTEHAERDRDDRGNRLHEVLQAGGGGVADKFGDADEPNGARNKHPECRQEGDLGWWPARDVGYGKRNRSHYQRAEEAADLRIDKPVPGKLADPRDEQDEQQSARRAAGRGE